MLLLLVVPLVGMLTSAGVARSQSQSVEASMATSLSQSQHICGLLNRFEKAPYDSNSEQFEALIMAELDFTERNEAPKSSLVQSDRYSRKFKAFLRDQGLSDSIETMEVGKLSLYLRYFYHHVRAENGDLLSPSTLGCKRAGISRYLRMPPVNRNVDILNGGEFAAANRMLTTVARQYLKAGGRTKRYQAIADGDMAKMIEYLNRSSPQALQDEVVFTVVYYFGQHGREGLRQLTRNSCIRSQNSQ